MKKATISLLLISTVVFFIFLFNQETIEGYVISSKDSKVWVIRTSPSRTYEGPDIKDKTQAEINELYNGNGTFFNVPAINKITKPNLK